MCKLERWDIERLSLSWSETERKVFTAAHLCWWQQAVRRLWWLAAGNSISTGTRTQLPHGVAVTSSEHRQASAAHWQRFVASPGSKSAIHCWNKQTCGDSLRSSGAAGGWVCKHLRGKSAKWVEEAAEVNSGLGHGSRRFSTWGGCTLATDFDLLISSSQFYDLK